MHSLANQEDAALETALARAEDERFANDVNTLAVVFRQTLAANAAQYRGECRQSFAQMLRYVSTLMNDGWGASDALYPQQVYDDHGASAVLLALMRAYRAIEMETK